MLGREGDNDGIKIMSNKNYLRMIAILLKRKLSEIAKIPIKQLLILGDAFNPNGTDSPMAVVRIIVVSLTQLPRASGRSISLYTRLSREGRYIGINVKTKTKVIDNG